MKEDTFNPDFRETAERWQQFNWAIHTIIYAVGVLIVVSVGYGFFRGAQLYRKYVPLIDASMEMRLEATTAYLWFEEMLGGDKSKTLDDILNRLDLADWYAKAMIEGGESSHLKLLPVDAATIHESILSLEGLLKRQRELLGLRMKAIAESGPGSDIDQLYHTTLVRFLKQADDFEMEIKGLMAINFQMFKSISIGIVCFCVFLFMIIGFGFYRYDRLRRKNYSDILQMQRLLVQNEKMAALGTMIAGIAHEMNNPNNFISFNVPILQEYIQELLSVIDEHAQLRSDFQLMDMPYKEFCEDLRRLILNIENGSNRVNRIVSDLKDFSRKKDKMQSVWFDIETVVEKVGTICGSRMKDMVDSFEINVSENLPQVHGDPEIVELILINFLYNAAEATEKPNGWVKLNVSLDKQRHDGPVIEVKDNGRGIKDSDLERIFDPFFSTKSAKEYTGMGLYLCHTLADQMGARIEVDSEVGKGSSFRLIPNDQFKAN